MAKLWPYVDPLEGCMVVLDFDGVEANTAIECGVAASFGEELAKECSLEGGSYLQVAKTLSSRPEVRERAVEVMDSLEERWKEEEFKSLLDARPLVITAADFKLILDLARSGERPDRMSREEFSRRVEAKSASSREEARREFYVARYLMKEVDEEMWLQMNRPYHGSKVMVETLQKRIGRVAVATSKDGRSTQRLLESYGFLSSIELICGVDQAIYGHDGFYVSEKFEEKKRRKVDQIREVAKRTCVPLERMAFLDDQRQNCREAKEMGVLYVVALQGGYDTPENLREGLELGEYDMVLPSRGKAAAETLVNGFISRRTAP